MKLDELRNDINEIDEEILNLFKKRMQITNSIAEYKLLNNLEIYQPEREKQVINTIRQKAGPEYENYCDVLFNTIMDISKCNQEHTLYKNPELKEFSVFDPKGNYTIAIQGSRDSYSHSAAKILFARSGYRFYKSFDDIFNAVETGKTDFGIIPIQNSTAGAVTQSYNIMSKHNFYIAAIIKQKIEHCLAVKRGVDLSEVYDVYSHEQALAQCSQFIKDNKLNPIPYSNTASACEMVSSSTSKIAAICSVECAQRCGLKIVATDIANVEDNYTKFIVISKSIQTNEDADIVSVSLSLPHVPGALYKLLTKFAVVGLNLLRIESAPIAGKDFNVIFYLDFKGNIKHKNVAELLYSLKNDYSNYKFLGNYSEVN